MGCSMTILVTGATGGVGRLVVERLVELGERVRAMTRNPQSARFPGGVEVVRGDLAEPSTLLSALEGVDRLYLFPVAQTAREVVGLAKQAGVRRIVVLSSGAVTGGFDTDFHLPVERAVQESGLQWTHLRPGEFMLNKLWLWGPSIRTGSVVYEPFPDAAWYPVHERDIADAAACALTEERHDGKAYDLNGPELITRLEQVRAIAEAIGREVRLEAVTPQQARQIYLGQGGFAAANADFLLGFESYSGEPDPEWTSAVDLPDQGPLPTVGQVNGRSARTFAQWARDHATDFR